MGGDGSCALLRVAGTRWATCKWFPPALARVAEKSAGVQRHLDWVAERLPDVGEPLRPRTDESDAVILHLWQATQLVIDVALSLALAETGSAPATYAFRVLQHRGSVTVSTWIYLNES